MIKRLFFAVFIVPIYFGCPNARGVLMLAPLAQFHWTNGSSCLATLVEADSNFYGTTAFGGLYERGAIFRMNPAGALTNLIFFNGTNGALPWAGLMLGTDSNFYGTTSYGGTGYTGSLFSGYGTIFQMTSEGALTTLIRFSGTNGAGPSSLLTRGNDGQLYGTTGSGGYAFTGDPSSGYGTVFRVTTNGLLTPMAFFGGTNGAQPIAGLVQTTDGSFYGTTYSGGASDLGTVFQINTNGELTSLISFGGTNGANPFAGLVQGTDGNLYGTTANGGTSGNGTVFRMTTNGTLIVLVSFNNANGANPKGTLLQVTDDTFYGTTALGGTPRYGQDGWGTVFQITTNGILKDLVAFHLENGAQPLAGLVRGSDGNFYGTTVGVNSQWGGEVFRLVPAPAPVFQSATQASGRITFSWSAISNQLYEIQYSTDLKTGNWRSLFGTFPAQRDPETGSDFVGPDQKRFYRVVLWP